MRSAPRYAVAVASGLIDVVAKRKETVGRQCDIREPLQPPRSLLGRYQLGHVVDDIAQSSPLIGRQVIFDVADPPVDAVLAANAGPES